LKPLGVHTSFSTMKCQVEGKFPTLRRGPFHISGSGDVWFTVEHCDEQIHKCSHMHAGAMTDDAKSYTREMKRNILMVIHDIRCLERAPRSELSSVSKLR
jgi:hypothetical protein